MAAAFAPGAGGGSGPAFGEEAEFFARRRGAASADASGDRSAMDSASGASGSRGGGAGSHTRQASTYSGSEVDRMKEGFGTYRFSDGGCYKGFWRENRPHGRGVYCTQDGSFIDGEWLRGELCGDVTYIQRDGTTYKGQCANNLKNGYGRLTVARTGVSYEGFWAADKPEGHGVYANALAGTRYSGLWREGVPQEFGEITYADGSYYRGEVVDGRKSGQGSMRFADGSEYAGAWADDRGHGFGVFRCAASGFCYRGTWHRGLPHGGVPAHAATPVPQTPLAHLSPTQPSPAAFAPTTPAETPAALARGAYFAPGGREVPSLPQAGAFAPSPSPAASPSALPPPSAVPLPPEGSAIPCEFANPSTGVSFSGQFTHGELGPQGKAVFRDGAQYVGFWRAGLAEGFGTFTAVDGKTFAGNWTRGRLDADDSFFLDGQCFRAANAPFVPGGRPYVLDIISSANFETVATEKLATATADTPARTSHFGDASTAGEAEAASDPSAACNVVGPLLWAPRVPAGPAGYFLSPLHDLSAAPLAAAREASVASSFPGALTEGNAGTRSRHASLESGASFAIPPLDPAFGGGGARARVSRSVSPLRVAPGGDGVGFRRYSECSGGAAAAGGAGVSPNPYVSSGQSAAPASYAGAFGPYAQISGSPAAPGAPGAPGAPSTPWAPGAGFHLARTESLPPPTRGVVAPCSASAPCMPSPHCHGHVHHFWHGADAPAAAAAGGGGGGVLGGGACACSFPHCGWCRCSRSCRCASPHCGAAGCSAAGCTAAGCSAASGGAAASDISPARYVVRSSVSCPPVPRRRTSILSARRGCADDGRHAQLPPRPPPAKPAGAAQPAATAFPSSFVVPGGEGARDAEAVPTFTHRIFHSPPKVIRTTYYAAAPEVERGAQQVAQPRAAAAAPPAAATRLSWAPTGAGSPLAPATAASQAPLSWTISPPPPERLAPAAPAAERLAPAAPAAPPPAAPPPPAQASPFYAPFDFPGVGTVDPPLCENQSPLILPAPRPYIVEHPPPVVVPRPPSVIVPAAEVVVVPAPRPVVVPAAPPLVVPAAPPVLVPAADHFVVPAAKPVLVPVAQPLAAQPLAAQPLAAQHPYLAATVPPAPQPPAPQAPAPQPRVPQPTATQQPFWPRAEFDTAKSPAAVAAESPTAAELPATKPYTPAARPVVAEPPFPPPPADQSAQSFQERMHAPPSALVASCGPPVPRSRASMELLRCASCPSPGDAQQDCMQRPYTHEALQAARPGVPQQSATYGSAHSLERSAASEAPLQQRRGGGGRDGAPETPQPAESARNAAGGAVGAVGAGEADVGPPLFGMAEAVLTPFAASDGGADYADFLGGRCAPQLDSPSAAQAVAAEPVRHPSIVSRSAGSPDLVAGEPQNSSVAVEDCALQHREGGADHPTVPQTGKASESAAACEVAAADAAETDAGAVFYEEAAAGASGAAGAAGAAGVSGAAAAAVFAAPAAAVTEKGVAVESTDPSDDRSSNHSIARANARSENAWSSDESAGEMQGLQLRASVDVLGGPEQALSDSTLDTLLGGGRNSSDRILEAAPTPSARIASPQTGAAPPSDACSAEEAEFQDRGASNLDREAADLVVAAASTVSFDGAAESEIGSDAETVSAGRVRERVKVVVVETVRSDTHGVSYRSTSSLHGDQQVHENQQEEDRRDAARGRSLSPQMRAADFSRSDADGERCARSSLRCGFSRTEASAQATPAARMAGFSISSEPPAAVADSVPGTAPAYLMSRGEGAVTQPRAYLFEQPPPAIIEQPPPAVIEQPPPTIVEQPPPTIVEQPPPTIIEQAAPAIVEQAPVPVVYQPPPEVIFQPPPVVIEQPPPVIVEQPPPVIVAAPQPVFINTCGAACGGRRGAASGDDGPRVVNHVHHHHHHHVSEVREKAPPSSSACVPGPVERGAEIEAGIVRERAAPAPPAVILRKIPKFVEVTTRCDFVLPQVQASGGSRQVCRYPVLVPRFVEIPVPEDLFDSGALREAKKLAKNFDRLAQEVEKSGDPRFFVMHRGVPANHAPLVGAISRLSREAKEFRWPERRPAAGADVAAQLEKALAEGRLTVQMQRLNEVLQRGIGADLREPQLLVNTRGYLKKRARSNAAGGTAGGVVAGGVAVGGGFAAGGAFAAASGAGGVAAAAASDAAILRYRVSAPPPPPDPPAGDRRAFPLLFGLPTGAPIAAQFKTSSEVIQAATPLHRGRGAPEEGSDGGRGAGGAGGAELPRVSSFSLREGAGSRAGGTAATATDRFSTAPEPGSSDGGGRRAAGAAHAPHPLLGPEPGFFLGEACFAVGGSGGRAGARSARRGAGGGRMSSAADGGGGGGAAVGGVYGAGDYAGDYAGDAAPGAYGAGEAGAGAYGATGAGAYGAGTRAYGSGAYGTGAGGLLLAGSASRLSAAQTSSYIRGTTLAEEAGGMTDVSVLGDLPPCAASAAPRAAGEASADRGLAVGGVARGDPLCDREDDDCKLLPATTAAGAGGGAGGAPGLHTEIPPHCSAHTGRYSSGESGGTGSGSGGLEAASAAASAASAAAAAAIAAGDAGGEGGAADGAATSDEIADKDFCARVALLMLTEEGGDSVDIVHAGAQVLMTEMERVNSLRQTLHESLAAAAGGGDGGTGGAGSASGAGSAGSGGSDGSAGSVGSESRSAQNGELSDGSICSSPRKSRGVSENAAEKTAGFTGPNVVTHGFGGTGEIAIGGGGGGVMAWGGEETAAAAADAGGRHFRGDGREIAPRGGSKTADAVYGLFAERFGNAGSNGFDEAGSPGETGGDLAASIDGLYAAGGNGSAESAGFADFAVSASSAASGSGALFAALTFGPGGQAAAAAASTTLSPSTSSAPRSSAQDSADFEIAYIDDGGTTVRSTERSSDAGAAPGAAAGAAGSPAGAAGAAPAAAAAAVACSPGPGPGPGSAGRGVAAAPSSPPPVPGRARRAGRGGPGEKPPTASSRRRGPKKAPRVEAPQ